MNNSIANMIEMIGIKLFALLNRKESDPQIFREYNELKSHEIQGIYRETPVFTRCEPFDHPNLMDRGVVAGLDVGTYTMPSKYVPSKKYKPLYDTFTEIKTIYFEHITGMKNSAEEKMVLIYLHGFSERDYSNEIKYLFRPLINQRNNMEVLAVHLPFHMKRSPKNQPYSGAYIFDSCPMATIEGMRQAVNDVSQIVSYAKEKYSNVLVGGFSLGGHVTSFLGTCDNRADLYIMGQAGARLPESLKNLPVCPGLNSKKDKWTNSGKIFEALYEPIELLKYKSLIPKEKVVSIAGITDRLITYERVNELRSLFESKYNIDYGSGHIGLLFEWKTVMESLLRIIDDEV